MKIIAGNFKSNLTRRETENFLHTLDSKLESNPLDKDKQVFIFPATSSLVENSHYKHINLGAQNCHCATSGAFTGEVTLKHLEEFHIENILIGHSERRNLFAESEAICVKKFDFFKKHGLRIFYCIGEGKEVREKNETLEFLRKQIFCIDANYENLIFAYEPLWAIGTGLSASISQIRECINYLKSFTNAPIIYGGSVTANNASEIFDIADGVLVGSASLKVEQFYNIILRS